MGGAKPSFYNDCLLAASSQDHGHVIVIHNRQDFDLIGLVEPAVRAVPPFPGLGTRGPLREVRSQESEGERSPDRLGDPLPISITRSRRRPRADRAYERFADQPPSRYFIDFLSE